MGRFFGSIWVTKAVQRYTKYIKADLPLVHPNDRGYVTSNHLSEARHEKSAQKEQLCPGQSALSWPFGQDWKVLEVHAQSQGSLQLWGSKINAGRDFPFLSSPWNANNSQEVKSRLSLLLYSWLCVCHSVSMGSPGTSLAASYPTFLLKTGSHQQNISNLEELTSWTLRQNKHFN